LLRLLWGEGRLSEFLEPFARAHLPGLLTELGRAPAAAIERFEAGHIACVRRVRLADGTALVLRAGFVDGSERGAAHEHVNRRLAGRGLCVPAIHCRRTFPFPRGRADVEILLEDYVEGRMIDESMRHDEGLRRALARTLLDLHADTSERPGRPWLREDAAADPVEAALAKAPEWLGRIARQLPEAGPSQTARCLAWLCGAARERVRPAACVFMHGDFCADNLLVTPDGRIALVDLGTMAYGCLEIDIVTAYFGFFERTWWERFCEAYFAGRPERRARFEANAPLFFALHFLRKAASRAVRRRKLREKREEREAESYREECKRFWDGLIALVERGKMP